MDTNWALRDRDGASSYAFFTHRIQLIWEAEFIICGYASKSKRKDTTQRAPLCRERALCALRLCPLSHTHILDA